MPLFQKIFTIPKQVDWNAVLFTRWGSPASQDSITQPEQELENSGSGFCLQVRLEGGLGISLVNTSLREELAFCLLEFLSVRITMQQNEQRLEASVLNIQVDNQILQAQCPVVVFVPSFTRDADKSTLIPVIEINAERILSTNHNIDTIRVRLCTLRLPELLKYLTDTVRDNSTVLQNISSKVNQFFTSHYFRMLLL
jgi:hypothetical protein